MIDYFCHGSALIDDGVTIGSKTKIWHFCHVLSGSHIGQNCVLGQNVMVGPGVTIGDGCKIQNNVSIYDGVTLEDKVFCGPSCVFTNVLTPRAFIDRKNEFLPTLVQEGASIGANATIICGTKIGRFSMIGASAVVCSNVLDYQLVIGVPARPIGWVSRTGDRLGMDLKCPRTGETYRETETGLIQIS